MKKIIAILLVVFVASCNKFDKDDDNENDSAQKSCASVSESSVPDAVQREFKSRYPQNTAEKWFNKDDKGFAAFFVKNETRTVAEFNNDGTFRTENALPQTPPSNSNAQQGPPCEHHDKCGQHHKPHGLFGLRPLRHHGKCGQEQKDKEVECHVEILN